MAQVTIYVEDSALQAAREAAARGQMSVSKWFAQFAEAERAKLATDRQAFWAEIDGMKRPGDDVAFEFLLNPATRHAGLSTDAPRESLE